MFTASTSGWAITSRQSVVAREAETLLGLAGARLDRVRAYHQSGNDTALIEPIADLVVRATMDLSHPPHADDADADRLLH